MDGRQFLIGVLVLLTLEKTLSTSAEDAGRMLIHLSREEVYGKATLKLAAAGYHIS